MPITHLQAWHLIGDCWMIFILVWVIAALNVKRATERWSPAVGFGYFLTSALTYLLLVRTEILGGAHFVSRGPWASAIAVAVAFLGVLITVWARITLGRNWSGSVTHKEDHELVSGGPYRFVRHPIYTGLLLMMVGTALVRGTADAFLAVVIFIAIHIWKLRMEEELMTRHFPDSYPAYRARTKALVPFLY